MLDEADEMLSRGFEVQVRDVFQLLADDIQVILTSATMPEEVMQVTQRFMRNPVHILIKKEEITLAGIKQYYVQVDNVFDFF